MQLLAFVKNDFRNYTKPTLQNLNLRSMSEKLQKFILLTGSDLGNRRFYLSEAKRKIEMSIGSVIQSSALYESDPWGFDSDTQFLNQALLIETALEPKEILNQIQLIEVDLGRIRESKQWTSRIIDIDILCSELGVYQSDDLNVPHVQLQHRSFALVPLCELVPHWIHPILNKPYHLLLEELQQANISTVS